MTSGTRQQVETGALSSTLVGVHPSHDQERAAQIQHRLDHLTKPRGSLGRLEEIVMRYGLARQQTDIVAPRKALFVFCADHGIAAEGVSAYPQDVTHQMGVGDTRDFLYLVAALLERYHLQATPPMD
jgi:NaMN:DMB phosphoribosyltransferase